jgi:excisionase family DNA binding protein
MGFNEIVASLNGKYKRLLISKSEFANELNVSEATIDRLRKAGAIKSKKVGGQIYFTLATVAEYIAE